MTNHEKFNQPSQEEIDEKAKKLIDEVEFDQKDVEEMDDQPNPGPAEFREGISSEEELDSMLEETVSGRLMNREHPEKPNKNDLVEGFTKEEKKAEEERFIHAAKRAAVEFLKSQGACDEEMEAAIMDDVMDARIYALNKLRDIEADSSDDKTRERALKALRGMQDAIKLIPHGKEAKKAEILNYLKQLNGDLLAFLEGCDISKEDLEWARQGILSGDYRDAIVILKKKSRVSGVNEEAQALLDRLESDEFKEKIEMMHKDAFEQAKGMLNRRKGDI